eukprot:Hpha_TRINITY_DN14900_c0_g3::TRINITY_DN14900_c0_g3_i1::g.143446::m.143446
MSGEAAAAAAAAGEGEGGAAERPEEQRVSTATSRRSVGLPGAVDDEERTPTGGAAPIAALPPLVAAPLIVSPPTRRLEAAEALRSEGRVPPEEEALWRRAYEQVQLEDTEGMAKDTLRRAMIQINSDQPPLDSEVQDLIAAHAVEGSEQLAPGYEPFREAMLTWYRKTQKEEPCLTPHRAPTMRDRTRGPSLTGAALGTKEAMLVKETFKRYDKDGTGKIRRNELKDMMTDLNSGIYPTQQEVDHVMWFSDTAGNGYLTEPEFEQAVTFWYIHTMEERERARNHCCTVL